MLDVAIAAPTSYDASRASGTQVAPPAAMDLDGVGKPDTTKLVDGGVQDWLGDHDPQRDPPDLTRVADRTLDLIDRGLVTQISPDDLKATDVYVYRLSTMQRIGMRRDGELEAHGRPHVVFVGERRGPT